MSKYSSYEKYINFINKYKKAINASSGSEVDSNANVDNKNIATMQGEIPKRDLIGINRYLMIKKITEMFGEELANKYIEELEEHKIYKHDETNLCPYTYSSKEVVFVEINGQRKLISFEDLYDLYEGEEFLMDKDKGVWCKYPKTGEILILDKDGWTNVSRLVKKKRHRDLVRVKTAFGEDLVVTDDHPLIVENDINATVPAGEANGKNQFKPSVELKFSGKTIEYFNKISPGHVFQCDTYFISQHILNGKQMPVVMDRDMGYFIGFFIGEGNYVLNDDGLTSILSFTQKNIEPLKKLTEIIYQHTGVGGVISYNGDKQNCWRLRIDSADLVNFLSKVCGIKHQAQYKILPTNIYDYTKEFAYGLIDGLIDSAGTVTQDGTCYIRLSSRTAIMQLTMLAHSLGFPGSNTIQNIPFDNSSHKTSYTIFGYQWKLNEDDIGKVKTEHIDGWAKIISVDKIEEGGFLNDNDFIYDITTDTHSFVCNGLWAHNCVSVTMYPFLYDGLKAVGGISCAPKHLDSFCGEFINFVFAVAAQFAGAVSTPEFLTYLDYFIRKEYGDDYFKKADEVVATGINPKTIDKVITDKFEQVVHSLNQPAAARNYQSVFWNIAYFDKNYFDGIFHDFLFPDGSEPQWESVSWLQKRFMRWFNKERLRNVLTFPVETVNLLDNGEKFVDDEWFDFAAEMYSEGHSFFTYRSGSVDSLASCCRLRNELQDNTFSFTLGAGGVSTGSKGVITININRLVQDAVNNGTDISEAVKDQVGRVHKYLLAFNEIMKDNFNSKLLPIYNAGFISLDKQFLTVGINGFVEGAEFLGIPITPNEKYFEYGEKILKPIYELNRAARTKEVMINTEFVPAENLGVKNAKWDKEDGYFVPRDCYNSYFYIVEDEKTNLVDKFILHGSKLTKYLDGGSALHGNLCEHLIKEQYKTIMLDSIKTGCSYFTFNVPNTVCNDCGYITKHRLDHCEKCGSKNIDYLTRVIGYLKRVSAFSEPRQQEESRRYYE